MDASQGYRISHANLLEEGKVELVFYHNQGYLREGECNDFETVYSKYYDSLKAFANFVGGGLFPTFKPFSLRQKVAIQSPFPWLML